MFKHRQRVNAAFAKGLMFGKAVGARDERDRIIAELSELITIVRETPMDGPNTKLEAYLLIIFQLQEEIRQKNK